MDKVDPLPCIICGAKLENVSDWVQNQVYGGTCFTSHGQYGSTVFDSFSPNVYLEINICDPCMEKKAEEKSIYLVKKRDPLSEYKFQYWDVSTDDEDEN